MTEIEQRIALAELRGMKGPWVELSWPSGNAPSAVFTNPKSQRLPDLTLDELHEAVKCLSPEQLRDYRLHVIDSGEKSLDSIDATKEQRAEALLRTVEKWKE